MIVICRWLHTDKITLIEFLHIDNSGIPSWGGLTHAHIFRSQTQAEKKVDELNILYWDGYCEVWEAAEIPDNPEYTGPDDPFLDA